MNERTGTGDGAITPFDDQVVRYYIVSTYSVDKLREDEIYRWFTDNAALCGYPEDPLGFTRRLNSAAEAYVNFLNGRAGEGGDGHGASAALGRVFAVVDRLKGRAARSDLRGIRA